MAVAISASAIPGATVDRVALLHLGQTQERIHDAPHGAEQADVGADRADRGQERQALLQALFLLGDGHQQAAFDAFQHAVGLLARLQLLERLVAGNEKLLQPGIGVRLLRLDALIQLADFAFAELLEKCPAVRFATAQTAATLDDQVPAEQRGQGRGTA